MRELGRQAETIDGQHLVEPFENAGSDARHIRTDRFKWADQSRLANTHI